MQTEKLIDSLVAQTNKIIQKAEQLKTFDTQILTWKEIENEWNILECLEHLNLYGNFYLPTIESKIKNSNSKPESEFKPGILGNYFAQSMLPPKKLNKMKTFKNKNPLNTQLDGKVLVQFAEQQIMLLSLLEKSKNVSLNKVKIPTSISRLLRLKLGDTLLFYINHIVRHLNQIERIEGKYRAIES